MAHDRALMKMAVSANKSRLVNLMFRENLPAGRSRAGYDCIETDRLRHLTRYGRLSGPFRTFLMPRYLVGGDRATEFPIAFMQLDHSYFIPYVNGRHRNKQEL